MNYVKQYYGVPADIGRCVTYRDKPGIIYEEGGNYVAVNFDSDKPGHCHYIHPTDPGLIYGEMGQIRKMTKSQQRYRLWQQADSCLTFAEYIGIKK